MNKTANLSIPEQHLLKIARDTMKMNCVFARIMGGTNHREAVIVIQRLTGRTVKNDGCTC